MADYGGILARGAEGGFAAAGDIYDKKINASLEEKKASALKKKQKNMLRLSQEFGKSERIAGQDFRKSQRGSGQYLDGRELTSEEFSTLKPDDASRVMTTEKYQESLGTKKGAYEKTKSEREHRQKMELARLKSKGQSTKDKEYESEQALLSLNAKLSATGGIVDPESMTVTIETDKKGVPKDKNILSILDKSGFEFTSGKLEKKDRPYWFTGDDNYVTYHLGAYKGAVAPGGIVAPSSGDEEKTNSFESLIQKANSLSNKTKAEKAEQGEPVGRKTGILSPGTTEIENPALPENIAQWKIETKNRDGKTVFMVSTPSGMIELSPEEVQKYKDYISRNPDLLKRGFDWIKSKATGPAMVRGEYKK